TGSSPTGCRPSSSRCRSSSRSRTCRCREPGRRSSRTGTICAATAAVVGMPSGVLPAVAPIRQLHSAVVKEWVMRRLAALAAGVVLMAAFAILNQGDANAQKAGKNHTVEMHDDYFKPKEITIKVGDTITWVNKGNKTDHAVSDDNGKTFKTPAVKKG